jgi:CBS domain-containing protein
MDAQPPTIRQDVTVSELANRIAAGDPRVTRHQGIPIVDDGDRLVGIVTRGDVMKILRESPRADATVLDAGGRDLVVTYPDETVREAVVKLLRHGIGRLPVVRREDPQALVGYLGRANVMSARLSWYRSEHTKQRCWPAEAHPDRVGA